MTDSAASGQLPRPIIGCRHFRAQSPSNMTRRICAAAATALHVFIVASGADAFAPAETKFAHTLATSTGTTCTGSACRTSGRRTTSLASAEVSVDPKEAVKLFGRLAEKYIMLDDSGGMCCYSACSDCEFRLPDGGYKMADQSAARPKWIPVYEHRAFETLGKEHASKWSTEIFAEGPAVSKDEFVAKVTNELAYAPSLGGPYLSASGAAIEDDKLVGKLFDLLAGDKEKLTKHRMSTRMKEIAGEEEALTWPTFLSALEEYM